MHGERPDEESCVKNTVVSVRDRRFHRISTTGNHLQSEDSQGYIRHFKYS